jgi:CRP-like cAMP-binding protein
MDESSLLVIFPALGEGQMKEQHFLSPWLDPLPFAWPLLEKIGKKQIYQKNETVFHLNQQANMIYLILEGRVRLYSISSTGEEKMIAIIGKNGLLGENCIFHQDVYYCSAMAVTRSVIIKIHPSDFKEVIFHNERYLMQVLEMMNLKIRVLSEHAVLLAFNSSFQRLCKTLIQLALNYGEKTADGRIRINIPFTLQEFANQIGTTRVTVANHIKKLHASQVISKKDKYYYIHDLVKLMNMDVTSS